MTAETQVRTELEDKSSLGMSSCQDLSKVGADCNGIKLSVHDDSNANGRDDHHNSYVFVGGTDDDPVATRQGLHLPLCANDSTFVSESQACLPSKGVVEVQSEKLNNYGNGRIIQAYVESDDDLVDEACLASSCNHVSPQVSLGEANGAAVQDTIADTVTDLQSGAANRGSGNQQVPAESMNGIKSAPSTEWSPEFPIIALDSVTVSGESHELKSVLSNPCESSDAKLMYEDLSTLDSAAELGMSRQSQNMVLEAPIVEDEEVKCDEQTELDSSREAAELEATSMGPTSSHLGKGLMELAEEKNIACEVDYLQSQESQIVFQCVSDEGNKSKKMTIDGDATLKTETTCCRVSVDITVSETEELDKCPSDIQSHPELNKYSATAESFPSEYVKCEPMEPGESLHNDKDAENTDFLNRGCGSSSRGGECEIEGQNGLVQGETVTICPVKYCLGTEAGLVSVEPEKKEPSFPCNDVHIELEVSNGHVECADDHTVLDMNLDPERPQKESNGEMKPGSEIGNSSAIYTRDCNEVAEPGLEVLTSAINSDCVSIPAPQIMDAENAGGGSGDEKLICLEADFDVIHHDGILTSLSESSAVNYEHAPISVPENVENKGDQFNPEGGIGDKELSCEEADFEASHQDGISTSLLESSAVNYDHAPVPVADILNVENKGDQLNPEGRIGDKELSCEKADFEASHRDVISTSLPESSAVNCDHAPASVAEVLIVENDGDQLNPEGGIGDKKLSCEEADLEAIHQDGISTSLPESSAVNDNAPVSLPEILSVENEGDQLNLEGRIGDQKRSCEGADFKAICQDGKSMCLPERSAVNCEHDVENAGDQLKAGVEGRDEKPISQESDFEAIRQDKVSTSLPEGSSDAVDGKYTGKDSMTRLFHYLIRVPRFDDEKLRDEIRHAQLKVDEKTRLRDAVRVEIQKRRASCQSHGVNFEASRSEARAARNLVRSKRLEIDSVQSVINRVKNAMSVEDIDSRIYTMEHMMQHETLPLKEEKQFIREIKQLKHLREQLASNMGSQDEVQQAWDQRDQIEERLKILKKELDGHKDRVSKAEMAADAAGKKCDDESKMIKELQAQFRAADDVRQEAYGHLLSLRKKLFEKNKHFRLYKDNAAAANDYVLNGDREAIHRLCVNQVETIMDMWNKNDEFRKEYVRCTMRNTVRKFGTLDGRSLGPDEAPPVLPSIVDEKVDRLAVTPTVVNTMSLVLEREKTLPPAEEIVRGKQPEEFATEEKNQIAKTNNIPAKSILGNAPATVFGRNEIEGKTREEDHMQTKEELESLRKAEELRKEEASAILREQRRMEEKAKAREALERKKKNAEKAQMRAELRAQKEAEQREKEREKRLRKKERKKTAGPEACDGNDDEKTAQTSDNPAEATKEPEIAAETSSAPVAKRHQRPSQFAKQSKTKTIPPPLRNRGRRRMLQWMWISFAVVFVVALFLLGNIGFFSHLGRRRVGF